MTITKKQVQNILKEIPDPELHISLIDLGLIYGVQVKKNHIYIKMTLTTLGCPLFGIIENTIKEQLNALDVDQSSVHIELTFDPPWSIERMSPAARAMLGI